MNRERKKERKKLEKTAEEKPYEEIVEEMYKMFKSDGHSREFIRTLMNFLEIKSRKYSKANWEHKWYYECVLDIRHVINVNTR